MTPDPNIKPRICIIVAMTENHVIGRGNKLPWHLPDDLKHFQRLTTGHTVVMGRRTFESIGCRPLPRRRNIVVTRNKDLRHDGVEVAHSVDDAIDLALKSGETDVFICGGQEIYRAALARADRIYLTQIHTTMDGDAIFPELDMSIWRVESSEHHDSNASHPYAMTFKTIVKA